MIKLLEHFQAIIPQDRHDVIMEEYTMLKVHLSKYRSTSISLKDALSMVIKRPGGFCNIRDVVELMLVMSPSTAECERGFSSMNSIKTKLRNGMNQETLQSLMLISIHGPSVADFNPDPSIEIWMSGAGGKHFRGHKKQESSGSDVEITHL